MAQYRLNTRLFVARPLDETFAFFADAGNLQTLTPARFVDEQLWGPYWRWHHTHTFAAVDGGTMVEDTVRYSPIGGALMHGLMVKRDLERIFTFRQHAILKQFEVVAREPIAVRIDRI